MEASLPGVLVLHDFLITADWYIVAGVKRLVHPTLWYIPGGVILNVTVDR
jgi:hypothetical protein